MENAVERLLLVDRQYCAFYIIYLTMPYCVDGADESFLYEPFFVVRLLINGSELIYYLIKAIIYSF
jgi:hypothetical protein